MYSIELVKTFQLSWCIPARAMEFLFLQYFRRKIAPADKNIFRCGQIKSFDYSDIENLTVVEILEEQDKDPNAKFLYQQWCWLSLMMVL